MPDRDIFNRVAGKGWASTLRRLHGVAGPDEVGRVAMKCLTHDLQLRRGLPAAREIITTLEALRGARITPSEALAKIARLKVHGGTYVHLCVAVGRRAR